ncbi:MFS transporter [Hyphococcus flavus]|uniref:MFS transporter n=1 Tax=Hyphococcus flavus TaxID=1866326 RepID=A0AAE9Z9Z4_9PROT|nr:MFS transporter [Hyphococcus flavus]WDI30109.1 MFS transporter [Hyphococcus flavus]
MADQFDRTAQAALTSDSKAWPSPVLGWWAVFVLTLSYTAAYIDRQILGLLVEPIRNSMQINDTQISLLGGAAFALFYVIMGLPLGRLADRVNRRNLIAGGIFVWSLMTAMCGLATNFWQLFMMRVGVGIGEATLSPAALSMISDYFPPKKRARPLGTYMVALAIGSGLAFLVGGKVLQWMSGIPDLSLPIIGAIEPWQAAFIIVGLPGLLLVPMVLLIREPARRGLRPQKTDTAKHQQTTLQIPLKEVARFVFVENRNTFMVIFIAFGLLGLHSITLTMWLPPFFQRTFGWDTGEVGTRLGIIILIFASLGMIGGTSIAQWMNQRGLKDAFLRAPLYLTLVMAPLAIALTLAPNAWISLGLCVPVIGLSFGLFAFVPGLLQSITPNQMRGQLGALFSLFNNVIGLIFGPTLVALITDFIFKDPMALKYSMTIVSAVTLPIAAIMLFLGLKHFSKSIDDAQEWIDSM